MFSIEHTTFLTVFYPCLLLVFFCSLFPFGRIYIFHSNKDNKKIRQYTIHIMKVLKWFHMRVHGVTRESATVCIMKAPISVRIAFMKK
jgi:hypothetical protein